MKSPDAVWDALPIIGIDSLCNHEGSITIVHALRSISLKASAKSCQEFDKVEREFLGDCGSDGCLVNLIIQK